MEQKQPQSIEERELELKLLDDCRYSSGWIQSATHLMIKCNFTEEELCKFDAEQLQILLSVITSAEENKDIWVEGFLNPELNATQMQLILTGYSHGLTTQQLMMYFEPKIPYAKSNWGISALAEGFNINEFIIDGYSKDQIYEIYAGIKDGVDISIYAKKEISPEYMAIARHALVLGLNPQFDENKKLSM